MLHEIRGLRGEVEKLMRRLDESERSAKSNLKPE